MIDHSITIFTVKIQSDVRDVQRDEFGYIDGHGPTTSKRKSKTDTFHIKASTEDLVRLWISDYYRDCENVTILSIEKKKVEIDIIIRGPTYENNRGGPYGINLPRDPS